MSELVSLKNVGKSYSGKMIFSNVNMTIKTTEPTVIMGKNGCGKSTLLKIIAGALKHTEGEVKRTPNIKIGYVPDRFPKLPFAAADYLRHMGKIQGIPDYEITDFINRQFEDFGISDNIKTQKISKCSKGTIQKINILQAFLGKPQLLIMDEPFSGLDEDSVEQFMELLKSCLENKIAIILSCHERSFAQRVTNDLFVFDGGANR